MMKKVLALLVALMMVLTLTPSFAEEEPVHLTYWIASGAVENVNGTEGQPEYVRQYMLAQKFMEANPDVVIDIVPTANDSAEQQQKFMMAAGVDELPDLFDLTISFAREFGPAGVITDLTPYFEARPELVARLRPGAIEQFETYGDGKMYAFPTQTEAQGWYYNTALFEQYDLELPVTWEDFIHCVEVFKANGVLPIAQGAMDVWARWGYDPFFHRYGLLEELDALTNKELSFADSTAFLGGFKRIEELVKAGAYAENVSTTNNTQATELFLGGQAAMFQIGTWELSKFSESAIAEDIAFNWGPTFSDGVGNQEVGLKIFGWGIFVGSAAGKDEAKMDAIMRFFEFIASEEMTSYQLDSYGHLPATISEDSSSLAPLYQSSFEAFDDSYEGIQEVAAYFESSFCQEYWNCVSAVITGVITAEEACEQLQMWADLL